MGDSVLEECEALHRAVRLRRHALCQPLVRTHSPAIITHFSPKTGQTALHAAVKEGLYDILIFFLQHKDINIDVLDSVCLSAFASFRFVRAFLDWSGKACALSF
eukprot:m.136882 g.136882  ORF g.136882 m.136882 type:complete len:104 (-) comp52482_c0_seq4:195-506(-)